MNYLLVEAEDPIRGALERLVAKPEALHPFVVIDKVGDTRVFVQFATKQGVLYFDVPALGVVLEPSTPSTGAVRAVAVLFEELGVALDCRVMIHEEDDKSDPPPWDGEPFWRGIFSFA